MDHYELNELTFLEVILCLYNYIYIQISMSIYLKY